ncbi:hypothetical protein GW916_13910 [bacterium]|nr:hypothetical protein [bacterium]
MIFVLEDDELRIEAFRGYFEKIGETQVLYAVSVDEAKDLLQRNREFRVLFLDHDLGGEVYVESTEPNTGYQVAKFIKENAIIYKTCIVHSMNVVGAENIRSVLRDANLLPFAELRQLMKNGLLQRFMENQ